MIQGEYAPKEYSMAFYDHEAEVDRNFDVFEKRLPKLLQTNANEFALMRTGEIIEFFEDSSDALAAGRARFGSLPFSVQHVSDRQVDLGFFSHAIDTRIA
jgi:hypothetical protein